MTSAGVSTTSMTGASSEWHLGIDEDVVPNASLQVVLHLWQVEVGSCK